MWKDLVGCALILVLVAFGISGVGYAVSYVLEPRQVALDNKVFHQSQSYNDGMARDLDEFRAAYLSATATPESKAAIRASIIHRFAGYDAALLPPDLRSFLIQVRGY